MRDSGRRKEGEVICTVGIWTVKEGREDEFARRWQESADRTALEVPGTRFKLLRDRDHGRRFVSLGEGWHDAEQVRLQRESPAFQDSMASIWRVLEGGEMFAYDLVLEIS
jgi:heme-degrading monooxygenase HmoA